MGHCPMAIRHCPMAIGQCPVAKGHACTMIIIHARTKIIVYAYTMIILFFRLHCINCFEIQHCSSPGCLSHRVQIEKDALSTAASHEAPVHKRARQDCKQKRIFSTGASREAPVDKRARQDCNQNGYFQQMLRTGFPVAAWVPRGPKDT